MNIHKRTFYVALLSLVSVAGTFCSSTSTTVSLATGGTAIQIDGQTILKQAVIPFNATLPNVDGVQTLIANATTGAITSQALGVAYTRVHNPFYFVIARETASIAVILFSKGQQSVSQRIIDHTATTIGTLGSLALSGLGTGMGSAFTQATSQNKYNLYVKPLIMTGVGLIGMTVSCSLLPDPILASGASSIFQGLTNQSARKLASNAISQGFNTRPVKQALAAIKQPQGRLMANAFIIMGTLGLIAAAPLLLPYAATAATAIASSQATGAIALTTALSALTNFEESLVAEKAEAAGSAIVTTVSAGAVSLTKEAKSTWQSMTDFVSTLFSPMSFEVPVLGVPME